MRKLLLFIALLLLVAVGVVFASLNAAPVRLHYYLGSLDAPLSVVLLAALALGAGLGTVAASGMVLRARREIGRLRKRCELCEQEIRNLRQIPIKDPH